MEKSTDNDHILKTRMQQIQSVSTTAKRTAQFLHIDMTPMVDLGFLLITFFIFTTSMTQKTSISLSMPVPGEPIAIAESNTISLLLKDNIVLAYEGLFEHAQKNNTFIQTDYSEQGIRNLLENKKSIVEQKATSNSEMIVLIKPTKKASYSQLVKLLDEMQINAIRKYAVVDPSKDEASFIEGLSIK